LPVLARVSAMGLAVCPETGALEIPATAALDQLRVEGTLVVTA
jgi:hypothetical protein